MDVESLLSPQFWRDVAASSAHWAVETVPRLLLVLLLAVVALRLLAVALSRVERRMTRSGDDAGPDDPERRRRVDTLIGIARSIGVVAIWSIVVLMALMQVGVNVAPLIAGAGVLGLAVGFGAQELVRDLISGFFNLMENHVRTGDVAVINGTGGVVERIGLRTTVLRDLSGVVHVFQNGKVDTIANMTKEWSAMVFDVGVAYKEDTDEVASVMAEVARELQDDGAYADKILEPMEIFGVDEFADSAVVIKARFKTAPLQQWSVGREYRRRLKRAFDRRGIEIPFPYRTLVWSTEAEPVRVSADGSTSNRRGPQAPGPAAPAAS